MALEYPQSSPTQKGRPVGVWLVAVFYASLAALELYAALDQLIDPFTFEGEQWGMWNTGAGPYVVAHSLLTFCSAVGILLGKPWGRIGITISLTVAAAALVRDYIRTYAFLAGERSLELRSFGFWWWAAIFPLGVLATLISSAWYVFSRKVSWYFVPSPRENAAV